MRTNRSCVLCILNQILRVCDFLKLSPHQTNKIFKTCLKRAAEIPYEEYTAPQYSEKLYQVVTNLTGMDDPYEELKKQQNQMVLDQLDEFRQQIAQAEDPLLTAGYYALLGNIIDYGGVRIFKSDDILRQGQEVNITLNDYHLLKEKLSQAKQLVILGDNAGEAVFDRLFIEEIKSRFSDIDIYYGVRSKPAINDVLLADAQYIGIDKVARVEETGATCAGTVIPSATPRFRRIFQEADVVISKGQGNFETLEQEERDIFFIFKVKCQVVAEYTGLKLDSLVFAFKESLIQSGK